MKIYIFEIKFLNGLLFKSLDYYYYYFQINDGHSHCLTFKS